PVLPSVRRGIGLEAVFADAFSLLAETTAAVAAAFFRNSRRFIVFLQSGLDEQRSNAIFAQQRSLWMLAQRASCARKNPNSTSTPTTMPTAMRRRERNSGLGEPKRGTIGAAKSSPHVKPPRWAMLSMRSPEPITCVPALIERPRTRLMAAK